VDFYTAWTLCVAFWALLRFWLHDRLRSAPITHQLARVTWLALLEQLIIVSGAAALAGLMIAIGTPVLRMLGHWDTAFLKTLLEWIKSTQESVSHLKDLSKTWLIWLLGSMLVAAWFFSGRSSIRARLRRRVESEVERLNFIRESSPEQWDSLPPNDAMKRIDEALREIFQRYQEMEANASLTDAERDNYRAMFDAQGRELAGLRTRLDFERRMNTEELLEADFTIPPEQPGWRKAMTVFMSRGLFHDAKFLTKVLTVSTFVMMFVSMVGFQGGGIASAAVQGLNRMQVNADAKSARDSFENATHTAEPPKSPKKDWSADDEADLDHLSRHMAHASFSSQMWGIPPDSKPPSGGGGPTGGVASEWHQTRADAIRRQILDTSEPPSAAAESLSEIEKKILDRRDNPERTERLMRSVAEKAKAETKPLIAQLDESAWQKMKAKIKAHRALYGQVMPVLETRSALAKEVYGVLFDKATDGLSSESKKVVNEIVGEISQDVVEKLIRTETRRVLADLHGDFTVEEALQRVRHGGRGQASRALRLTAQTRRVLSENVDSARLARYLQTHPPSSPVRQMDDPALKNAGNIAKSLARNARTDPRTAAEALATYEDYFPGRLNGESETALGKVTADLAKENAALHVPGTEPGGGFSSGGGVGGGGGGGGASKARGGATGGGGPRPSGGGAQVSFARSRSFSMARGFARVGGVLIGVEPTRSDEPINVTDLEWKINGREIALFLRHANRTTTAVGTYPSSLVNLALRYAADARVTTVTMVSAQPLLELKILLHPALEDTALGCRAIEIDRFVDTYARRLPSVRAEEERIQSQYDAYRVAWFLRQLAVVQMLDAGSDRARQLASRISQLSSSAEQALKKPEQLVDSGRSILAAMPAYFDPELVRFIASAARQSKGDLDQWTTLLGEDFKRTLQGLQSKRSDEAEALVKAWFEEPATFEVWSGVRESAYRIGAGLEFLRPTGALQPFEFVLQASFTSVPQFGDRDESKAEPFEYGMVRGEIAGAIESALKQPGNSGHRDVFQRMREFTILQRLFRAAFAVRLGPVFPLEKLVALQHATRPALETNRTLRWNVRPGGLERAMDELLTLADMRFAAELNRFPDLRKAVISCRTTACNLESPIERFTKACDSGGQVECRISELLKAVDRLVQGRALRVQLGVERDEQQALRERSCQAMR